MAQTDVFNPTFGTYYGNEFYADNTGVGTLNASTFYVGCRIVPLASKQVDTIQVLNWSHGGSFVSETVELQSDNSGQPSGSVLASGTFTPAANFTWNSVTLGTPFTVTAGTVYWVVIHSASNTGTNTLEIRRIDDPGAIITPVYQMYTSSNSGSTWSNSGSTFGGCVGFGYHDSTFEGIGYGDFDTNNIGNSVGTSTWGEYFSPPSTITVSAVGMTIYKSTAGTPTDDCTVSLFNADTSTLIESGIIVTAGTVTQTATWYTFNFSSNHTLSSGTNYRVYLSSTAAAGAMFTIRTAKTTGTGNGNALSFGGTGAQRTNGTGQTADHEITFRFSLAASLPLGWMTQANQPMSNYSKPKLVMV